ncbi:MAG TPA: DUF6134 family protein [Patescibacteria group bacterium]|nr:DUF6134 family protein [Patescibacteria group bacterium]
MSNPTLRRLAFSAVTLASWAWSAAALAAETGVPPGGALDFDIVRKGDVIGLYHSDFTETPDGVLAVRTHIKAEVSLGPIRLYHFDSSSVESWRQGRLIGLIADSDDNGDVHHLQAQAQGETLVLGIDGKASAAVLPADSVPSSLWSADMLRPGRPIFDFVDGQRFVATTHCDPASVAEGQVCTVTGELERNLHYAPDGVLDHVDFAGDDGSQVSYRPR